jgi:hypothetical protein
MPVSRVFSNYPPGSLARKHPSRFPSQSSHRERCPTYRAPFSHLSKSPVDEPTPGCLPEERCPSPDPSFHNPGTPVKEPSAVSLFRERQPITRAPFIHLSKSPVDKPPSRFPSEAPVEIRPVYRAFSTYPSGSPAREPSLQVPFTEPFSNTSQSLR